VASARARHIGSSADSRSFELMIRRPGEIVASADAGL